MQARLQTAKQGLNVFYQYRGDRSFFAMQAKAVANQGFGLLDTIPSDLTDEQRAREIDIIFIGTVVSALNYHQARARYDLGYASISQDPNDPYHRTLFYPRTDAEISEVCQLPQLNHALTDRVPAGVIHLLLGVPNIVTEWCSAYTLRVGEKVMNGELPFEVDKMKAIFPTIRDYIDTLHRNIATRPNEMRYESVVLKRHLVPGAELPPANQVVDEDQAVELPADDLREFENLTRDERIQTIFANLLQKAMEMGEAGRDVQSFAITSIALYHLSKKEDEKELIYRAAFATDKYLKREMTLEAYANVIEHLSMLKTSLAQRVVPAMLEILCLGLFVFSIVACAASCGTSVPILGALGILLAKAGAPAVVGSMVAGAGSCVGIQKFGTFATQNVYKNKMVEKAEAIRDAVPQPRVA